ncbi:hypothetical protein V6N13_129906 [Hibiscus sabdariffa]|uniref:Homeobox domain-containing protein n=1 Tax=Hibiscus sabdariffa TaxID=183260 RepID=A0ABR2SMN0_9ROSI
MGFNDTCNPGLALSLRLGCLGKQENFSHRRKKKKLLTRGDQSLTLGSSDEPIDLHRKPSSVSTVSLFSNSSVKKERDFGGGGDEDDEGSHRKKLRLSKRQSAILEDSFKEHSTLNPKKKQALADQLSLRPRQVEVWFQNRRARTRLKQTEVDCELLKKRCETLTEENKRLHKELQQLKSWKLTGSYCMQATLTMCPSCQRVADGSKDSLARFYVPLSSHPSSSAACS